MSSQRQPNFVTTVFDLQRTAVQQTQKATRDTIEAQKNAVEASVDSLDGFRSLSKQNAEMSKSMFHAYLDAVESTMPEGSVDFDDLREFVDDQYDVADEAQTELLDSLHEALEEGSEAYESYADSYADAVDDSFDAFLDAHERLESSMSRTAREIDVTA